MVDQHDRDLLPAEAVHQDRQLHDIDMVLGSMTMICERWTTWAFSMEYLPAGQRLLLKRDSGIKEIEDMGGRKACASTGSTNLRYIQETKPTNGKPIGVVSANSETDCTAIDSHDPCPLCRGQRQSGVWAQLDGHTLSGDSPDAKDFHISRPGLPKSAHRLPIGSR